jgi:DNA-binding PadR family transcriptional regulator
VTPSGQGRDGGPDRVSYALTEAGRSQLDDWLTTVETPAPYVVSTLFTKVVVSILAADEGRAREYLIAQRAAHVARMRELTALKTAPGTGLAEIVAADYAIAHLDADLKWLDTTLHRVAELYSEVHA